MTSKQKIQQYAIECGFNPENFSIEQLIEHDRKIRAMYSMLLKRYTEQAHERAQQIARQTQGFSAIHVNELKLMTIENLVKKFC